MHTAYMATRYRLIALLERAALPRPPNEQGEGARCDVQTVRCASSSRGPPTEEVIVNHQRTFVRLVPPSARAKHPLFVLHVERGARARRLVRAMAAGAVVALLSACSGSSNPSVQPAVKAATVNLFEQPVQLPWAAAKATAACMAEHGFEYPPYTVFDSTEEPGTQSISAFAARPLTLQEAQRDGCGDRITRGGDGDVVFATEAVHDYLQTLPPAERKRYWQAQEPNDNEYVQYELNGGTVASVATEGCIAEGRKAVYGSVENALRLQEFGNEILPFTSEAVESDEVQDAADEYAGCMEAEGYQVATPGQALQQATERFAGGLDGVAPAKASPAERSMAVADAICQQRSSINAVMEDQLFVAASDWLNENEGQILGYAELQRDALKRAQRILAAP